MTLRFKWAEVVRTFRFYFSVWVGTILAAGVVLSIAGFGLRRQYEGATADNIAKAKSAGAKSLQTHLYEEYRALHRDLRRSVRNKIADMTLGILDGQDLVPQFYERLSDTDIDTKLAVNMWKQGWRLYQPEKFKRRMDYQGPNRGPAVWLTWKGTMREVDPQFFEIYNDNLFLSEGDYE